MTLGAAEGLRVTLPLPLENSINGHSNQSARSGEQAMLTF
jgi:hypothetical protein